MKNTEVEIWKIISEKPNYSVSNLGRIVNNRTNRVLKPIKKSSGYYEVSLGRVDNKQCGFLIHRLVAKAFIENPENKPVVNHKDLDKLNNSLENLEWCTYSENRIHYLKNK